MAGAGKPASSGAKIFNGADFNKLFGEKFFIRTNNFKKFFGEWEKDPENSSKVVKNGEPLVVYHGTKLQELYFKDGYPYTRSIPKFEQGLLYVPIVRL
ncbi:MAG: hypothetical protein MJZ73_08710 [Bacteroidaceae bacterium]|nr:hypothetical protein [Bacteroidaceae bacterium]